jgi:hypothetical protein
MTNDDPRRLATEEQRERFHLARRRGGLCAACGRSLEDDEAVYVERFTLRPETGRQTWSYGPVGAECASPERVREAEQAEPERCAGCGRAMHYRLTSARRQTAICSRRCRGRALYKRPKAED